MTTHRPHRAVGSLLLSVIAALVPAAGFAQTITVFPLSSPNPGLNAIVAGPDGNLWFTELSDDKIGRITTEGVISEFVLPSVNLDGPSDIVVGPDGALWFTEQFADRIGRITTGGAITEFPIGHFAGPARIAAGPDGSLWFTELESNRIGRITTGGVITGFPLPTFTDPLDIAAGPNGTVWFTARTGIGRITSTGVITEFTFPTPSNRPWEILVGPDGNLWYTYLNTDTIGRITPSGGRNEFPIPTTGNSGLSGITIGPDGNFWVTETSANRIARITPGGVLTEFPIPTRATAITPGPDGNIWFTTVNAIGRLSLTSAPEIDLRVLPVVGSTVGVGGSFFRTSVQLHNSGTTPTSGGIRFHPSGTAGSSADPVSTFTLAPGETRTIPDLLPSMNLSGLGSADVFVTTGNAPIVTARVFNDAGAAGTTGFSFDAMSSQQALSAGHSGVLLIPTDLVNYRLNVGLRTLDANVSMTLTVRNAAGSVAATVPKFFPATYHEQQTASAFLNGLALPAGGSITVSVEAGSAIVYGATVDNRTGDPSLQLAAPAP